MRAEEAILFLVVAVLSLALVAAVVAPILRQKRSGDRSSSAKEENAVAVGGPVCPTCHCQLSVGFRFCPFDGAALATEIPMPVATAGPHDRAGDHPVIGVVGARKICPTCARRYRLDVAVCERDGASLVPVN
ncbi:MAG TPA: hypothetical protein VGP07_05690 [Polyangia bacterium]|jgi:hypothetical protein